MIVINYVIVKYLGVEYFIVYATFNFFADIYFNLLYGGTYGEGSIISKTYEQRNIDKGLSLLTYTYKKIFITTFIVYFITYFAIDPVAKIFIESPTILKDIKYIYISLGIVSLLGINSIYASGYLTAVKKSILFLVTSCVKSIFFAPFFVTITIIIFGKQGLWIGILVSEIIYIPIVYIFLTKVIRKIKLENLTVLK